MSDGEIINSEEGISRSDPMSEISDEDLEYLEEPESMLEEEEKDSEQVEELRRKKYGTGVIRIIDELELDDHLKSVLNFEAINFPPHLLKLVQN